MNSLTTKSLTAAPSFIPAIYRMGGNALCLDLYPARHQNTLIYKIREPDETDSQYGQDGRRLAESPHAQYIDIYA